MSNPQKEAPKDKAKVDPLTIEKVAALQLPINQTFCMPATAVRFCPVKKGQLITIDAGREKLGQVSESPCGANNGLWHIGDAKGFGPVGKLSTEPYGAVNAHEPLGALLCAISIVEPSIVIPASTPTPWSMIFSTQSIAVGTGYRTTSEIDGFLYLSINDGLSDLSNNGGGVPVRVTIRDPQN
jgi:hypothetical protein